MSAFLAGEWRDLDFRTRVLPLGSIIVGIIGIIMHAIIWR